MRKASAVRKLYAHLRGRDRLRAAAELVGKGYVPEGISILDTAEWLDGRVKDPEMVEGLHELRAILMQFDRMSAMGIAWLDLLEILRPRAKIAAEAIGREEPDVWLAEAVVEIIDRIVELVRGDLQAIRTAYLEAGAERIGLSADAMLVIVPGWVTEGYSRHGEAIDAASPPEDRLALAQRAIVLGWGPDDLGGVRQAGEY